MSAIFLSHSSRDGEVSARIKAWLESRGHRSVFLDFDPQDGIPAGRSWEQELYAQLRACRAVIVLCSAESMRSRWCFAEITHARSLGKQIFPVRIDDTKVDGVLTDLQVLDFRADEEAALERLAHGLLAAGVDATDPLDWDGSRPPYPGLLAFHEADAAVFFGRDREIGRALDLLNQMRRYGGARLLLLLGGSGSGKSSLMRAGLLPRLRRDEAQWLVVDPVRPGDRPAARLATVLARAAGGAPEAGREIEQALAVGGERRAPGEALVERLRQLRRSTGRDEATVVLFLDQLEELLGHPGGHPADRFLGQLAAALAAERAPLLVVATLRSDFLATFQQHPALRELPFRSLSLGPIARERVREIIERPAALAGLDLEPALVEALLLDTEAEDALPLLAFTLRELWELSAADRRAPELTDYRDRLGGLDGSLARSAEGVLATRGISEREEKALRGAFLGMARLGHDGTLARRAIGWEQLSEPAHEWLERFVQARLLVSRGEGGESTLEVAHEVLFRAWERLAAWLDENREALLLHHDLVQAARLWERGGQAEEDLWRGGRLHRALEVRDRAFAGRGGEATGGWLPVADPELDFLAASEAAERRAERRRRRGIVAVVAASLLVAAFSFGLYLWASWERRQTEIQGSRVLAQQAYTERDQLDLALLLAVEASRTADTREARTSLLSLLAARPRLATILDQQAAKVHSVAITPAGDRLAAAGDEGTIRLYDLATGEGRELARDLRTFTLAFSPDGDKLAAVGTADGAVRLWGTGSGDLRRTLDGAVCPPFTRRDGGRDTVYGVAFNPRSRLLATADGHGLVRLWDESSGACLAQEPGHADAASAVTFDRTGRWLASTGEDGVVRLWEVMSDGDGARLAAGPVLDTGGGRTHDGQAKESAFAPAGRQLVSVGTDGRVLAWDLTASPPTFRALTAGGGESMESVAFNPDGALVAAAGDDGVVHFWDAASGELRRSLPAHADLVSSLAFGPGDRLATTGEDRTVRLWNLGFETPTGFEMAGGGPMPASVALAAAGGWAAASGGDGLAVWEVTKGQRRFTTPEAADATALSLSPDGSLVAAGDRDGRLVLWPVEDGAPRRLSGLEDPGNQVWSLAFSADGSRLAVGSGGARVVVADASVGDGLASLLLPTGAIPPGQDRVRSLAFSTDGDRLAAGIGPTVQLWDLSACGALAAGCATEATVLSTEDPKAEFFSLAFSADGGTLYAGAGRGTLHRWSLVGGGVPTAGPDVEAHEGIVRSLRADPVGGFLVSGSADQRIVLWRANGMPLYDLRGHQGAIEALALAGGHLFSVDEAGSLRVWPAAVDVDLAPLRHRACRVANRQLTAAEWEQFIGPNRDRRPTCPQLWTGF